MHPVLLPLTALPCPSRHASRRHNPAPAYLAPGWPGAHRAPALPSAGLLCSGGCSCCAPTGVSTTALRCVCRGKRQCEGSLAGLLGYKTRAALLSDSVQLSLPAHLPLSINTIQQVGTGQQHVIAELVALSLEPLQACEAHVGGSGGGWAAMKG